MSTQSTTQIKKECTRCDLPLTTKLAFIVKRTSWRTDYRVYQAQERQVMGIYCYCCAKDIAGNKNRALPKIIEVASVE